MPLEIVSVRVFLTLGVKSLETAKEVEKELGKKKGTVLVMVNSVCGCAAGSARPGVALALQNELIPDNLYTVFAGVDIEATERARELMADVPPSSPSVGLFKNGKLVYFLPRQEIEGFTNQQIADKLITAFNNHCTAKGPSVDPKKLFDIFALRPKTLWTTK